MSRHTYGDVGYSGVGGDRYREDDEGYAQVEREENRLRDAYYRAKGVKLIAEAREEAKRRDEAKAAEVQS